MIHPNMLVQDRLREHGWKLDDSGLWVSPYPTLPDPLGAEDALLIEWNAALVRAGRAEATNFLAVLIIVLFTAAFVLASLPLLTS